MRLILTLLKCSTSDIIWDFIHPLFAAADYLNMTVSNKEALATLDTLSFSYWLFATDFRTGRKGGRKGTRGAKEAGRKEREVGDLKGKEAREIRENNVSLFYKGPKG